MIENEYQHILLEQWLDENGYTWGDVMEEEQGQYVIDIDELGNKSRIYLKKVVQEELSNEETLLDI